MSVTRKIFKYQIWHLISLAAIIFILRLFLADNPEILKGKLWGVNTGTWFWIAIIIPVIHQVYVWIIWRLELYKGTFTKRYGLKRAFNIYAVFFSLLIISRVISIVILACSNKETLRINTILAYVLAGVITLLVIYLFYSVKKYFTFKRAYGIDHFDKNYNEPYVKQGIFKYTDNGMYIYGLLALYLPGLLFLSKAAILAALFNHVYIWVHYYFTERPDMLEIYGSSPE